MEDGKDKQKRKNRSDGRKSLKLLLVLMLIVALLIAGLVVVLSIQQKKKTEKTEPSSETLTSTEIQTTTQPETTTEKQVDTSWWGEYNGHTIYLTFDDGPSSNTLELLSIFEEYGIHATFFVLRQEGSEDIYRKIIEQGSAIGVHSTSHDYGTIYASLDSFKNDVDSCRSFIKEVTGVESKLYRFPGGSNNQVHATSIFPCVDYITSQGMRFFDWNVSSGDAAQETCDVDFIYNNLNEQIRNRETDTIVTLAHDSWCKTTTVEAVRRLVPELLRDGYRFSEITDDTPAVQFQPCD